MPQPVALWIERFATRLIQLQPQVRPLDAVRNATSAFESTSDLSPEDAAEVYLASAPVPLDEAPAPKRH